MKVRINSIEKTKMPIEGELREGYRVVVSYGNRTETIFIEGSSLTNEEIISNLKQIIQDRLAGKEYLNLEGYEFEV